MRSRVDFKPIEARDREQIFAQYKSALVGVIENAFGWNEEFQRERFKTRYASDWFFWIEIDAKRIGYICYFKKETEIHLSLLILDSENRKIGLGRLAMNHLHDIHHSAATLGN